MRIRRTASSRQMRPKAATPKASLSTSAEHRKPDAGAGPASGRVHRARPDRPARRHPDRGRTGKPGSARVGIPEPARHGAIVQGRPVLAFLFSAARGHRSGQGVQLTEHHDDEPMPIPSTWRQPTVNNDDRWYRQQMGAAVLGLVAGLMVVVPAVLWLSGWLGGPQTRASVARQPAAEQKTADVKTADVKPVRVQVRPVERSEVAAQYVAAAVEPRPVTIEPPPVVEQVPAAAPQSRAAEAEGGRPAGTGRAAHRERRHTPAHERCWHPAKVRPRDRSSSRWRRPTIPTCWRRGAPAALQPMLPRPNRCTSRRATWAWSARRFGSSS